MPTAKIAPGVLETLGAELDEIRAACKQAHAAEEAGVTDDALEALVDSIHLRLDHVRAVLNA